MSIEEFHSAYPADENFVEDVSKRQEYGTMSPVRYLSGIYIREGMHGLSITASKLARRVEAGTAKADKKDHEAMLKNAASVYLGHTIITIEDMIIHRYFDQEMLNSKLEYSFTGTTFNPKLIEYPIKEPLEDFEVSLLTSAAEADKTFVSFFKNKYSILPKSLRILLTESGTYKPLDEHLLPEYSKRAKQLVEANEAKKQGISTSSH